MAEALVSSVAGGTAVLTYDTAVLAGGAVVAADSSAAVEADALLVNALLGTDCCESAGDSRQGSICLVGALCSAVSELTRV